MDLLKSVPAYSVRADLRASVSDSTAQHTGWIWWWRPLPVPSLLRPLPSSTLPGCLERVHHWQWCHLLLSGFVWPFLGAGVQCWTGAGSKILLPAVEVPYCTLATPARTYHQHLPILDWALEVLQ